MLKFIIMKFLNKIIVFVLLFLTNNIVFAQEVAVAKTKITTGIVDKNTRITLTYGSPAVAGRAILDEFLPYSKIWSPGSGNVTVFETDKDLMIQDDYFLPAGKYSLFVILEGSEPCTIIFNKNFDQFDITNYDAKKDQLRIKVNIVFAEDRAENLVFAIKPLKVCLNWDKMELSFKATEVASFVGDDH